jgi:hypothetical protein
MSANQTNPCEHKFVHLETKKQAAERGSWGLMPSKDWERTDIFFCERCLEYKIVEKNAPFIEFQDGPPNWW